MSWNDLDPTFKATAEKLLSPRELDVLKCLTDGKSQRRTARHLNISRSNVRTLRDRATQKLADAYRQDAA
jgi:DNA-binding CsgD family transcriptional regulator